MEEKNVQTNYNIYQHRKDGWGEEEDNNNINLARIY